MISDQAQAFMERLYSAAEHAGFLVECTWLDDMRYEETAMVNFRTHDQSLLHGLVAAADPTITYPLSAIPELAKGTRITIEDKTYSVREITVIGDGTEARATLSPSKGR